LSEVLCSRGTTIALSCLIHLGLVAMLVLGQHRVPVAVAVRPPVLPVQLVTLDAPEEPRPAPAARPAPPPRQRIRPPRLIEPSRPSEVPPAVKVEEPAPSPVAPTPVPAAIDPSPVATLPAPTSEAAPGPPATSIVPLAAPDGPAVSTAPVTASASPSTAIPEGVTQYARPRGGYQVRPSYPAAPRRQGIQGTTLLRIHVLADGRIGDVLIEQSAGHPDLDQAARDAVRAWRFEPARRGSDPVAMWVLLPVEFRLK